MFTKDQLYNLLHNLYRGNLSDISTFEYLEEKEYSKYVFPPVLLFYKASIKSDNFEIEVNKHFNCYVRMGEHKLFFVLPDNLKTILQS